MISTAVIHHMRAHAVEMEPCDKRPGEDFLSRTGEGLGWTHAVPEQAASDWPTQEIIRRNVF